jgi:hypothetical protein
MSVESVGVELRMEKTTSGFRWQFSDIMCRGCEVVGILGLRGPRQV